MSDNLIHPVELLAKVRSLNPGVKEFEFGVYEYVPQSADDQRSLVKVHARDVVSAFGVLQRKLRPNHEVAVHSRIKVRSAFRTRRYHLPMVDLVGKPCVSALNRLAHLANSFGCRTAALVDSGRSFHFYGLTPIPEDAWLPLMGRLLLLNLPGADAPVVDSRWIGHRLLAGYGSLRLSFHTSHYVAAPRVVCLFDTSRGLNLSTEPAAPSVSMAPAAVLETTAGVRA